MAWSCVFWNVFLDLWLIIDEGRFGDDVVEFVYLKSLKFNWKSFCLQH